MLSIRLYPNSVPKGSSLPSQASVDCWRSGSVTEVTAAGLNIHLVPSTDTKISPSLSTSNTFPVRPRIYKWNKVRYYLVKTVYSPIAFWNTYIIGSRLVACIVYFFSFRTCTQEFAKKKIKKKKIKLTDIIDSFHPPCSFWSSLTKFSSLLTTTSSPCLNFWIWVKKNYIYIYIYIYIHNIYKVIRHWNVL